MLYFEPCCFITLSRIPFTPLKKTSFSIPKLRISGALQYLLWFLEGMKEISVEVCLNEYTWLEIYEEKREEKWIASKRPRKKMVLKKRKEKKYKCNLSFIV